MMRFVEGKTSHPCRVIIILDFPLLIVCPSNLISQWKYEILKHFKGIKESSVQVIESTNKNMTTGELIYLSSYNTIARLFSIKANRKVFNMFK